MQVELQVQMQAKMQVNLQVELQVGEQDFLIWVVAAGSNAASTSPISCSTSARDRHFLERIEYIAQTRDFDPDVSVKVRAPRARARIQGPFRSISSRHHDSAGLYGFYAGWSIAYLDLPFSKGLGRSRFRLFSELLPVTLKLVPCILR